MKRVEVTILGQSYVLSCPEGGEQALSEAATRVDREMCAIRDAGKLKARERIAVLAALNLAYDIAGRPAVAATATAATPSAATALSAASLTASLAASSAASSAGPTSSADAAQLGALIARIDEALADDGRLI